MGFRSIFVTRKSLLAVVILALASLVFFEFGDNAKRNVEREIEQVLVTTPPHIVKEPPNADDSPAGPKPFEEAVDPEEALQRRIRELVLVSQRLPEQRIPEMRFLELEDWEFAASGPLETVRDYRIALSKLRERAERRFAGKIWPSLNQYLVENDGVFPNKISELKQLDPHLFGAEFDSRYELHDAMKYDNIIIGGSKVITQTSFVDSEFDHRIVIGVHGYANWGPAR